MKKIYFEIIKENEKNDFNLQILLNENNNSQFLYKPLYIMTQVKH